MSHGKPSVSPETTQRVIWVLIALCALFLALDVAIQLHLFGWHKHGELGSIRFAQHLGGG